MREKGENVITYNIIQHSQTSQIKMIMDACTNIYKYGCIVVCTFVLRTSTKVFRENMNQ